MSVTLEIEIQEVANGFLFKIPEIQIFIPNVQKIGKLEGQAMISVFGGGTPGQNGAAGSVTPAAGVAAVSMRMNAPIVDKAPTVDAVIEIRDMFYNLIGYGPSPSPYGVFAGRTDLLAGAKWRFGFVAGLTLVPLPGGVFTASGPAGTYNLPWVLHNGTTVETGVKTGITLS